MMSVVLDKHKLSFWHPARCPGTKDLGDGREYEPGPQEERMGLEAHI